jgi:hypothetical protein
MVADTGVLFVERVPVGPVKVPDEELARTFTGDVALNWYCIPVELLWPCGMLIWEGIAETDKAALLTLTIVVTGLGPSMNPGVHEAAATVCDVKVTVKDPALVYVCVPTPPHEMPGPVLLHPPIMTVGVPSP